MKADSTFEPSKSVEVPEPVKNPGNPLRRVAFGVLLLAAFLFALSVFMERRTPISSQATVQAFVISIAPEVAGRVVEVGVIDNTRVSPKQMLFRIDPDQYQIAVSQAEARLDSVGQSIGASTAAVSTAQAKLVEARASRDLTLEQANRAKLLVEQGVYPKSRYDQAKSGYDQALAAVDAAKAELKRAEQQLGPVGADNPQLREALAALEKARLDLRRTTIEAPGEGVVTNLQLTAGGMLTVGQGALTFIDVDTVWITAAYKENSLENVAPGNRAEVLFDVLPGKLYPAKVESVGLGVAQGSIDPSTGLPKI
jgi:multidrug resistance efflux pump